MTGELFYERTRQDWINELERELRLRRDVYPRAVREHRMNARRAAWQIDTMIDLLNHLKENAEWKPKPRPDPGGATINGATD